MGYCGVDDQSGFAHQTAGFRGWSNFIYGGMGRGWRHRFLATGIPGWAAQNTEQETADLKAQADWLKTQLEAIQKRINDIESR
jgi:hypothetical protein